MVTFLISSQFKYDFKLSSKENGGFKKGVLFATYSSLIGESQSSSSKYHTRLSQIVKWCGSDYDGVVSFMLYTNNHLQLSYSTPV